MLISFKHAITRNELERDRTSKKIALERVMVIGVRGRFEACYTLVFLKHEITGAALYK